MRCTGDLHRLILGIDELVAGVLPFVVPRAYCRSLSGRLFVEHHHRFLRVHPLIAHGEQRCQQFSVRIPNLNRPPPALGVGQLERVLAGRKRHARYLNRSAEGEIGELVVIVGANSRRKERQKCRATKQSPHCTHEILLAT